MNPPFTTVRPTDFVPIVTYAGTMNRRDVLDRLWRHRRPGPGAGAAAGRTPPPAAVAVADQPPRIIFASIAGGDPAPRAGRALGGEHRQSPAVAENLLGGESPRSATAGSSSTSGLLASAPIARAVAEFSEDVAGRADPRIAGCAWRSRPATSTAAGGPRRSTWSTVQAVKPPALPPRLFVLSIGSETVPDPTAAREVCRQRRQATSPSSSPSTWSRPTRPGPDRARAAPSPDRRESVRRARSRTPSTDCTI